MLAQEWVCALLQNVCAACVVETDGSKVGCVLAGRKGGGEEEEEGGVNREAETG
jgi:hypothetical protein